MRLWVSLLLCTALAHSGCTAPSEQPLPDTSAWTVPEWIAGDFWEFGNAEDWRRYQVSGVETVDGRAAYHVDYTSDAIDAELWIAVDDLSELKMEISRWNMTVQSDCPGIFPLVNRTEGCRVNSPEGIYQENRTVHYDAVAWLSTPAGTFATVRVWYDDPQYEGDIAEGWYSDEVRYLVQVEGGTSDEPVLLPLIDWSGSPR